MKRIIYLIITVAMCFAISWSTKSDYENEQTELAKERQDLAEEEAELRQEYEELRQEYLREKRELQRTVAKENKSEQTATGQLTSSELDTLSDRIRSSAIWPTSGMK